MNVTYEWSVTNQEPITQMESGRRLTVIPRKIEIHAGGHGAPGVLSVYLSGRRLNLNGLLGGVKAVCFFDDLSRWCGEPMTMLPDWARPYVEQVREWEGNRCSLDSLAVAS